MEIIREGRFFSILCDARVLSEREKYDEEKKTNQQQRRSFRMTF